MTGVQILCTWNSVTLLILNPIGIVKFWIVMFYKIRDHLITKNSATFNSLFSTSKLNVIFWGIVIFWSIDDGDINDGGDDGGDDGGLDDEELSKKEYRRYLLS